MRIRTTVDFEIPDWVLDPVSEVTQQSPTSQYNQAAAQAIASLWAQTVIEGLAAAFDELELDQAIDDWIEHTR